MLYVNGIITITKNAGNASEKSLKLIPFTFSSISPPIIIKIGAIAVFGISEMTGRKNRATKNSSPLTKDVKPVRPPAVT